MIHGELIVDNFAGGGGASTGIEMATGYSVDIAINHDPEAIKMHKANHPNTKHYCENVWAVDPVKACKGHPVAREFDTLKFKKVPQSLETGLFFCQIFIFII